MYIWWKGRVRLFVGNRGSGRVGSTFRRVGSGPRKVTRGQLWSDVSTAIVIYEVLFSFKFRTFIIIFFTVDVDELIKINFF